MQPMLATSSKVLTAARLRTCAIAAGAVTPHTDVTPTTPQTLPHCILVLHHHKRRHCYPPAAAQCSVRGRSRPCISRTCAASWLCRPLRAVAWPCWPAAARLQSAEGS